MSTTGSQLDMTVTSASPLQVLADGADTACPAARLDGSPAYAVGDRVQVQLRTPRQPLVTGKVATT